MSGIIHYRERLFGANVVAGILQYIEHMFYFAYVIVNARGRGLEFHYYDNFGNTRLEISQIMSLWLG